MRVGSLVYTTDQGLGILAKSFVDAGVVTDVLVVRHGKRPEHDEWYPNAQRLGSLGHDGFRIAKDFCKGMDAMLFFETPFIWELIPYCREQKIKTVLMPMYECEPKLLPYQPDFFVNPSLLDQQYYPDRSVFIPVPVHGIPWRLRAKAEVFVHNAGNGGLNGRNGTAELVEAMKYVTSPARLVLKMQEPKKTYWAAGGLQPANEAPRNLPKNIDLRIGSVPYEDLWKNGGDGDVFVFSEKFNGLSLPLQEAHAAGMLVMCGDRFPMNTWLPKSPLIPVAGYRKASVSPRCHEYDEAIFDPRTIAKTIDEWYGQDISMYSEAGREWAHANSWDVLKSRYLEVLAK